MKDYKAFTETLLTDHEFATWLTKHGGNWTYRMDMNTRYTHFFDENENRIAYAIYDNRACTRRTFLLTGLET